MKLTQCLPPQFITSLSAPIVPHVTFKGVFLTTRQKSGVTMLLSVPLVIALMVVCVMFCLLRIDALCFMTSLMVLCVVIRLFPENVWVMVRSRWCSLYAVRTRQSVYVLIMKCKLERIAL